MTGYDKCEWVCECVYAWCFTLDWQLIYSVFIPSSHSVPRIGSGFFFPEDEWLLLYLKYTG